jgi:methionine aminotransferase
MVFDGQQHQSAARLPRPGGARLHRVQLWQDLPRHRLEGGLRGRARAADGRVPQGAPVQRVHRQHAHAARPGRYMADPAPYLELPAFYQRKRDLFRAGPGGTRFGCCPARAAISSAWTSRPGRERDLSEADFCKWLTSEIGVAAIPLSAFYGDGFDQRRQPGPAQSPAPAKRWPARQHRPR